ncbi:MAG: lytic murein transglycosylase [Deltaproteobacteria bacterium]|jgi:membrane-bound lytic murein transglycosylase B|nr:lytic murein transglycosylase [Deltaproteobacteria bacterium]
MKMNKSLTFLLFSIMLASLLFLSGCGGKTRGTLPEGYPPEGPEAPPERITPVPLSGIPSPWGSLAQNLAQKGLARDRLQSFFRSSQLSFTPSPMETKLRELFPIFFRSDLTKAVQEKLYQLGYDIVIDGRNGSGTRGVIKNFQRDRGLPQSGAVNQNLSRELDKALASGKVRNLADYKPPPPASPNRSSTHGQFTNASAISQIRAKYFEDKAAFDRAQRAFQVPGPLIASIMWIETGYGNYFGKHKAAVNLASMAAAKDYKVIAPYVSDLDVDSEAHSYLVKTASERGAWAQDELQALLLYAWQNGLDPMEFPGSIYGAIGYGQFMPSNIKKFAVDGDGDGRIDLFNKNDAIFSIANYLKMNGWSGDMSSLEKRRAAIRNYNRSGVYVNTVLYVMEAISR